MKSKRNLKSEINIFNPNNKIRGVMSVVYKPIYVSYRSVGKKKKFEIIASRLIFV